MSTATAKRIVYERLASLGVALIAVHLPLDPVPAWADAVDDEGTAIRLIGRHGLGESEPARTWLATVVEDLRRGDLPEHVRALKLGPQAAEAYAAITQHRYALRPERPLEVLVDGPRKSGKTFMMLAALGDLGEQRRRADLDVLRVMWVQDTLKNAREKTGASMEEAEWGGCWTLREDRQLGVLIVGGVELAQVRFVGAQDPSAAEGLRAASHALVVEEAIPSLDTGGVSPRQYAIAVSSLLRLPTPRRVAVVLTNPGGPESWCFERWLTPTPEPECVRVAVPAANRLSEQEIAAQAAIFGYAPDLQARLARGEWADLILGPQVAKGFDPLIHVAKRPIQIFEGQDIWCGWDSGASHCHAVVIAQRNGPHRHVLAALVREDAGLRQFLDLDVLPWMAKHVPWVLGGRGHEWLIHRYDPSMEGFDGHDQTITALGMLKGAFGGLGHAAAGAIHWEDREGPMLDLLAQGDGKGGMALRISPVPETRLLIQALTSRWYYGTTKSGQVVKDSGPYKPNRPWEDLGDAFAYLCGGLAPPARKPKPGGKPGPGPRDFNPFDYTGMGRRRA